MTDDHEFPLASIQAKRIELLEEFYAWAQQSIGWREVADAYKLPRIIDDSHGVCNHIFQHSVDAALIELTKERS